jgi:hypothetical protein
VLVRIGLIRQGKKRREKDEEEHTTLRRKKEKGGAYTSLENTERVEGQSRNMSRAIIRADLFFVQSDAPSEGGAAFVDRLVINVLSECDPVDTIHRALAREGRRSRVVDWDKA